ncbi:MAG: response regulator [Cyanobacteria bacterium P01_G01_bin.54]
MQIDEALQVINQTLELHTGKSLTGPEREVLIAAWQNQVYSAIAEELFLSEGYIRDVASRLWKRLSGIFGLKISKSTFREFCQHSLTIPHAPLPLEGSILIVDDLPANLRLLASILRDAGHHVKAATNGQMALKALERHTPDLILLDIKMPGMDGYTICNLLKKNPQTQTIPVIFLSALEDVEDKMRAFEVGGVDYITKPFQVAEVLARIKTQLLLMQKHRQLAEEILEHQQTAEVLYQSRTLLANVINTTAAGILVLETIRNGITGQIEDFHCVVANPAIAGLLGKPPGTLMGRSGLKTMLQQLDPGLVSALLKLFETGQRFEREFCNHRHSPPRWYSVTAIRLGNGLHLSLQEITAYKSGR